MASVWVPEELREQLEQLAAKSERSLAAEVRVALRTHVAAKAEVYTFMKDLVEREGAGILLISSDLPEILHLAHRAYVMHRGRLRAELERAELTEQAVLSHFFETTTTHG